MSSRIFIGNKRSREIHTSDCYWAKIIKPKDKIDIDLNNEDLTSYLLRSKYDPCGHCLTEFQNQFNQRENPNANSKNETPTYTKADLEIAAYYNWRHRACPIGDELTDWLKAESLIKNR